MDRANHSLPPGSTVDRCYGKFRVLVADDQQGIVDLVELTVERMLGARVVSYPDGDRVLAALEQEAFDVFVTDMIMPGTQGFELLRHVRERAPEMDIIVMTGYPDSFPYVEVIQAGADDFIVKPFPTSALAAKLIRLFKERELRHRQRVAETKYKSLFELAVDGMLCLAKSEYLITDANRAFHEITGFAVDRLRGRAVMDLVEASERERFRQWLAFCDTTGRGMIADVTLVGANGKPIAADISATVTDAGDARIIFVAIKDVTEKRERDRLLAQAAERDELTGLGNRRAFNIRMGSAIAKAREQGSPVALMLIDLDNFKRVNDTLGHPAGDAVLHVAGDTIRGSVRTSMGDEGFRFGGDEFAVLLPGADRARCARVAERLRTEFGSRERHGTSMSIGVAEYVAPESVEELTGRADQALYKAKTAGKDNIALA